MKVAILGCGPAGLVAAHTAIGLGHKVTIFTNRVIPSRLMGCQYLHAPITGYGDVPSVRVSYRLNGTPEGYRAKVYGPDWDGKVSPEDFIGQHDAWDIRETYRRLWWDLFVRGDIPIVVHDVKQGNVGPAEWNDKIISSIPATALCLSGHLFRSHAIYAAGDKSHNGSKVNEIICDGTAGTDWYRKANVFGYETTEWPAQLFEHETNAGVLAQIQAFPPKWSVRVTKPLSTECTCHPEVIRVGRYGSWAKSVLVHQVPGEVAKELS
jgi:hypothetical protein